MTWHRFVWLALSAAGLALAGCGSTRPPSGLVDAGEGDDGGAAPACVPTCPATTCGADGCGGTCACATGTVCDEPTSRCDTEGVSLVPMRDGKSLWTKVFLPQAVSDAGVPTLMLRTPYREPRRGYQPAYEAVARFHARRGYAYVLQDTRAAVEQPGARFYSYESEVADGQDTSKWIAAQRWSNQAVGVIGGSYEGFSALAAAVDNPYVKVVIADAPSWGASSFFRAGLPGDMAGILKFWAAQGDDSWSTVDFLSQVTTTLNLTGLDQQVLGEASPLWQEVLQRPSPADPRWDTAHLRTEYGRICTPVLFVASPLSDQLLAGEAIALAQGVREQGCAAMRPEVRLFLGPQTHAETSMNLATGQGAPLKALMLHYLDKYLLGRPLDLSARAPVEYLLLGATQVRGAQTWPPAGTEETLLFGNAGTDPGAGRLSATPTPGSLPSTPLTTDPASLDPCAANPPAARFAAAPTPQARLYVGVPRVELEATNTTPDADLFVTLSDLDPANAANTTIVSSGQLRARYRRGLAVAEPLVPGQPFTATVTMSPAMHRLEPGHSLVLTLEGVRCGQPMNPHTGEPLDAQTRWAPTTFSVLHEATHPSRVVLPVVAP